MKHININPEVAKIIRYTLNIFIWVVAYISTVSIILNLLFSKDTSHANMVYLSLLPILIVWVVWVKFINPHFKKGESTKRGSIEKKIIEYFNPFHNARSIEGLDDNQKENVRMKNRWNLIPSGEKINIFAN